MTCSARSPLPEVVARLCVALAWLSLAGGCLDELPGKPNPADRPKIPKQITDFATLFDQRCTGCHGADGQLGPAPPLADALFLNIIPDDELINVITNGRAGTPMPAFALDKQGTLTPEQIKIVADGLKERWKAGKLPKAKLPAYAVASDDTSAADAKRGGEVFARACAACHGDGGQGAGEDEQPGAINDPALLALMSDQVLRRIIITGRHDLGMPNFADDMGRPGDFEPLSDEQIADLVALLASWRTPSGEPASSSKDAQAAQRSRAVFAAQESLPSQRSSP